MKAGGPKIVILMVLLAGAAAGLGWVMLERVQERSGQRSGEITLRPAPVEVAEIRRESIALQRTFSGELEAQAEFVVAPKVSGRIERMFVNIADRVKRGQVVAELDNDEYVQAVAQARADLEVARANLSEAESTLEIADREFERSAELLKRGIASDSEFDASRQDRMARQAQLKVAAAQVLKAESSLETANIRLGYTKVTAGWTGGDDYRVVAERYVDEGQTVAANSHLFLIVKINPIAGIFFVTERDYAQLQPGQRAILTTDAYPDEQHTGRIDRIAPVFRKSTRQARVEMSVDNPRYRLKPGMFIRASVVLDQVPDATVLPQQALTVRNDRSGIFILSADGRSVAWREVKVGIRQGDRVQVEGQGLSGRVVTLGQQLISDGSPVTLPEAPDAVPAGRGKADTP